MSTLIGLEYVGYKPDGVALVLYNTYKYVRIDALHPYYFNNNDSTDDKAIEYYNSLDPKLYINLLFKDTTDNSVIHCNCDCDKCKLCSKCNYHKKGGEEIG